MSFLDSLPVTILQWLRTTLNLYLPWLGSEMIVAFAKAIVAVIIGIMPVVVLTVMERKVFGRFQDRLGPNLAGPYGILTSIADAVKILAKEDVIPTRSDKKVFRIAPALIIIPSLLIYAVIPFGRGAIAADIEVGALFVIAMGSMTAIALLTAGWASGNKYSLISAVRAVAQLITYEVPMAFALLAVVLVSGGISMVRIVEAQSVPFVISMPLAAFIYFACITAEANRCPYDLLEGESEIVAGFNLEYSGMRFAMFYIAEYANLFTAAALTTTFFLGGYKGPLLPGWFWFFFKSTIVVFVLMWLRSAWPRLRIDHMLDFSWKFMVPLSMANLLAVALVYKLTANSYIAAGLSLLANIILIAATGGILVAVARRSKSRRLRALVLGEV